VQEPRPGRKVAQIEKGIFSAKSDLFGEDRRIRCAGAAGDDRSGIAKDRGALPLADTSSMLDLMAEKKASSAPFRPINTIAAATLAMTAFSILAASLCKGMQFHGDATADNDAVESK